MKSADKDTTESVLMRKSLAHVTGNVNVTGDVTVNN
jgi:hypothetical protein